MNSEKEGGKNVKVKKGSPKRRLSPERCPHRSIVTTLPRRDELSSQEFPRVLSSANIQGKSWNVDTSMKKTSEIGYKWFRLEPVQEEPIEHPKTHFWKIKKSSSKEQISPAVITKTTEDRRKKCEVRTMSPKSDRSLLHTEMAYEVQKYIDLSETASTSRLSAGTLESSGSISEEYIELDIDFETSSNILKTNQLDQDDIFPEAQIKIFEEAELPTENKIRAQEISDVQIQPLFKQIKFNNSTISCVPSSSIENVDICKVDLSIESIFKIEQDPEKYKSDERETVLLVKPQVGKPQDISLLEESQGFEAGSLNSENLGVIFTSAADSGIQKTNPGTQETTFDVSCSPKADSKTPNECNLTDDRGINFPSGTNFQTHFFCEIKSKTSRKNSLESEYFGESDVIIPSPTEKSEKKSVRLITEKSSRESREPQLDIAVVKSGRNQNSCQINLDHCPGDLHNMVDPKILNNENSNEFKTKTINLKIKSCCEDSPHINPVNREYELLLLNETINSLISAKTMNDLPYTPKDYNLIEIGTQFESDNSSHNELSQLQTPIELMTEKFCEEIVKDILYSVINDSVTKSRYYHHKNNPPEKNEKSLSFKDRKLQKKSVSNNNNSRNKIEKKQNVKNETKLFEKESENNPFLKNYFYFEQDNRSFPLIANKSALNEIKETAKCGIESDNFNILSTAEYTIYNANIAATDIAKAAAEQNMEPKLTLRSYGLMKSKRKRKVSSGRILSEESAENFTKITEDQVPSKYILKEKNPIVSDSSKEVNPTPGHSKMSSSTSNSNTSLKTKRLNSLKNGETSGGYKSLLQSSFLGWRSKKEPMPDETQKGTSLTLSGSSHKMQNNSASCIISKKPVISSESVLPHTESLNLSKLNLQEPEQSGKNLIDSRNLAKEILFLLKIILFANDYVRARNPIRISGHFDSDGMVTPEDSDIDTVT